MSCRKYPRVEVQDHDVATCPDCGASVDRNATVSEDGTVYNEWLACSKCDYQLIHQSELD